DVARAGAAALTGTIPGRHGGPIVTVRTGATISADVDTSRAGKGSGRGPTRQAPAVAAGRTRGGLAGAGPHPPRRDRLAARPGVPGRGGRAAAGRTHPPRPGRGRPGGVVRRAVRGRDVLLLRRHD